MTLQVHDVIVWATLFLFLSSALLAFWIYRQVRGSRIGSGWLFLSLSALCLFVAEGYDITSGMFGFTLQFYREEYLSGLAALSFAIGTFVMSLAINAVIPKSVRRMSQYKKIIKGKE